MKIKYDHDFEMEIYGLEGWQLLTDFDLYRFGWWDDFRLVKFGICEDKFHYWDKVEYAITKDNRCDKIC